MTSLNPALPPPSTNNTIHPFYWLHLNLEWYHLQYPFTSLSVLLSRQLSFSLPQTLALCPLFLHLHPESVQPQQLLTVFIFNLNQLFISPFHNSHFLSLYILIYLLHFHSQPHQNYYLHRHLKYFLIHLRVSFIYLHQSLIKYHHYHLHWKHLLPFII